MSRFQVTVLGGAMIGLMTGAAAKAEIEPPLLVEVVKPLPASGSEVAVGLEVQNNGPTSDGGELLRQITGVTGSRMGGRGIDPIIRGQKQNQLNILLDGAYLYGGCPNRMDPPTTYSAAESYDRLLVIKGNRSVIYGPGGSGGTVLFERERPTFEEGKSYRGQVSASYTGNSDTTGLSADLAAGGDSGYLRFISEYADADNYEDGNGNEVRSSYETESNTLMAGVRLGDRTWLEGSYEKVSEEDVLFPGAGMDSPYSDADTWRLKLDHTTDGGVIDRLQAQIYRSDVSHLMDNYTLRPRTAMMAMEAPTSSDTLGGRLLFDSTLGGDLLQWGMDHQVNERNASSILASGMMAGGIGGIQWPDVSIGQTGLFAELTHEMASGDRVKAGVRYDYVDVEAGRTDDVFTAGGMSGKTPDDLYGSDADDKVNEHNLGGFATWVHRLDQQYRLETTLSRSVRTADATERYMATSSWVGNPSLDPEKHHQLELMLVSETGNLSWSLAGYYNRVDDYIQRMGNRYQNIDARLYGIDFDLTWQLTPNLQLSESLSWVRGENLDEDTELSQIAPITSVLALDYRRDEFSAGVEWELAAKQQDICPADTACAGQDLRETPGYGVVNVDAGYALNRSLRLDAGIDNLFDQAYTYHTNREDLFGNQTQVYEPGRSGWVRVTARF